MSFADAMRSLHSQEDGADPPAAADEGSGEEPRPLTVTEACRRINAALLEIDEGREIRVEGEIGDCSLPGHWYFTLKDREGSKLSCAFFSSRHRTDRESPSPAVGMKVVVHGRPELYARGGRLSFIVTRMREAGLGDLHQRFERLKQDLRTRGWFDPQWRLPLPPFARRLLLITSADGAARRDVEETARRRWPGLELLLMPVPVQGEAATPRIARAVREARRRAPSLGVDAIILTRGGGSLEDLWCFNELEVAEAIFESRDEATELHRAGGPTPVPLVAAIGHESDVSIAELVADHRASTPTQAAMVLVPDASEQRDYLAGREERLRLLLQRAVERARGRIEVAGRHEMIRRPARIIEPHRRRVKEADDALTRSMTQGIERRRATLDQLETRLRAAAPGRILSESRRALEESAGRLRRLMADRVRTSRMRTDHLQEQLRLVGPESVLGRGYALVQDAEGRAIRNASELSPDDLIRATLARGAIVARVESTDTGDAVGSPT